MHARLTVRTVLVLLAVALACSAVDVTQVSVQKLSKDEAAAHEPWISASTMLAHHNGHFPGYATKFNNAIRSLVVSDPEAAQLPAYELVRRCKTFNAPEDVKRALCNNGGGYINHALFFEQLAKGPTTFDRDNAVLAKVLTDLGCESSLCLKDKLKRASLGVFGSGWAWLTYDVQAGKFHLETSANQDLPVAEPILTLDVWEHAYYLDHQKERGTYLDMLLAIIDWNVVANRASVLADVHAKTEL